MLYFDNKSHCSIVALSRLHQDPLFAEIYLMQNIVIMWTQHFTCGEINAFVSGFLGHREKLNNHGI